MSNGSTVIVMREDYDSPAIYVYQHHANDLLADVKAIVNHAMPRWTDPTYANRMALSKIFAKLDSPELGCGVSTVEIKGTHPVSAEINWEDQEVQFRCDGHSFLVLFEDLDGWDCAELTREAFMEKLNSKEND